MQTGKAVYDDDEEEKKTTSAQQQNRYCIQKKRLLSSHSSLLITVDAVWLVAVLAVQLSSGPAQLAACATPLLYLLFFYFLIIYNTV